MKKILTVLLIFIMCVCAIPCSASQSEITLLSQLSIMVGDPDGNFRSDDYISRAEFMKAAIAASSYKNSVASSLSISPFKDVTASYWAAPYIKLATQNGLCKGYMDATFRPDNPICYEEAITVLLKILGYTDDDFGLSWPYGQIGLAESLKITENVNSYAGAYVTRGQVATLIYNTLDTKMKNSQSKLISVFDCETIENAVIVATNNEDSSLGAGKVYTTAGTYKFSSDFDYSYVGKRGDLTVKNGEDFVSFTPNDQQIDTYSVTDVIGSDLLLNGTALNINENLTVYYKSQATTYKNVISSASKGDTFTVYKNSAGITDYAVLKTSAADINVSVLDKYIIYSQLDNAIIGYSNGSFTQIDLPAATTAYKDNAKTTYSQIKSSLSMGDIIYVKKNESGNIDYISYEQGNITGPVTLAGKSSLAQFGNATKIMRNGNEVTENEIAANDIAYYIADIGIVLVYSNKITGVYEKAFPNKDTPTTITVSGKEYNIESAAAFNKLSSGGSANYGDTITLLLGKTNEVADVITSNSSSTVIYGYMLETGTKEYTKSDLSKYSGTYAKIITSDGTEYEYITDKNYKEIKNSIVKATLKNGVATIAALTKGGYSGGKYSVAERTFGSNKLADDVNILDVLTTDNTRTGAYATVFESRIDGVNINAGNIIYMGKDSNGKVTDLILNNVTSDSYSYGVIVKADKNKYTYIVDGSEKSFSSSTTFPVYSGQAAMFGLSGNSVEEMKSLTKIEASLVDITDTAVSTANSTYMLSDRVAVYRKTNSVYTLIPLSDIKDSDYTLTGYYDKSEGGGGRVRIIIAQ